MAVLLNSPSHNAAYLVSFSINTSYPKYVSEQFPYSIYANPVRIGVHGWENHSLRDSKLQGTPATLLLRRFRPGRFFGNGGCRSVGCISNSAGHYNSLPHLQSVTDLLAKQDLGSISNPKFLKCMGELIFSKILALRSDHVEFKCAWSDSGRSRTIPRNRICGTVWIWLSSTNSRVILAITEAISSMALAGIIVPTEYKYIPKEVLPTNQFSVTEYFSPINEFGINWPDLYFLYDLSPIYYDN